MLGRARAALGTPARAARDRASQRPAAAEAGQHAARFLAHRGGARAGELSSPPIWRPDRAISPASSGPRSRRPGCGSSIDCPPLVRARLCRSRHVGEDRPQSALERLQVHACRRDRGRVCREAGDGGARLCATPGPAFPTQSCRACSSASIASRAARAHPRRHRHRPGAGAGAGALHGGAIRVGERRRRGHDFTVAHSARQRASAAGSRQRERAHSRQPRSAPHPMSRRRCAGCRERRSASGRRSSTHRRLDRAARHAAATRHRAHVLLADDNADMRDYLARLLATQLRRRDRRRWRGRRSHRSARSARTSC